MLKLAFSIFFSCNLLLSAVMPTVTIFCDDISELISATKINGEEENQSEKELDTDPILPSYCAISITVISPKPISNKPLRLKSYPNINVSISSPPPDGSFY